MHMPNLETATPICTRKKKARFCLEHNVIHDIPSVPDHQARRVWWQTDELQDIMTQVEQLVMACRSNLTKSPFSIPTQLAQRQTCQEIQGLETCTRQLLMCHQPHSLHDRDSAAMEVKRLCQAMQRTAALRGLEARLIPACRQAAQHHVRHVLRHSSNGSCRYSSTSQASALLAQVRALYDAA